MTPKQQKYHDELMYWLDKMASNLEKEQKECRMFTTTEAAKHRLESVINLLFYECRKDMRFRSRHYGESGEKV